MPSIPRALVLPAFLLLAVAARLPEGDPIRGFSSASAQLEREWELKFRAIPDPGRLRESMRRLSAHPHHVGSPYDKDNAEWLRAQYASYGWDATIEQFQVLFPVPLERVVELVAPTKFVAVLEEPAVAVDPTSSQKSEQLPTYNAYSADGDVTAPLVYVNYGVPDDYKYLERHGISVKGAIVIARYGGAWRGIKPKVAYEHGAVGCLIYSDPGDDGFAAGETFPAGPYRPKDGVQRGSVMDMPVYPGDPLTPGVGADASAKRLDRKDAVTLMKIPVMPISYADAQPLLAAITGPVAPAAWRGSLPITYRIGPGAARVHLKLRFDWSLKPLYDVIARIPGSTRPDEWVIRGNHHDAWVNGAEDPTSGQVAELEEARALGELLKQGWRPKRTIVYASWDGEEPALLGSTEWVEEHQAELKQKAVFYLNSDGNGRGALGVGGSYSLMRFANEVAHDIEDPETHGSVWQRMRAFRIVGGEEESRTRTDLRDRGARVGLRFHPVSPARRRADPQRRLRRRGWRRHLSFDLRRLLLVHAFQRHQLRVWPGPGPDRRHHGDADGRRRRAATGVWRPRRNGERLRHRTQGAPRDHREADHGHESLDPRWRLCRDERSAAPGVAAQARLGAAVSQLRPTR